MKRIPALIPFLLVAALLAGCGDDEPATMIETGTTATDDEAAIRSSVEMNDEILGSTQFMGEDEAIDLSAAGFGKTLAEINTVRWWRTPDSIERSVEIEFSGGDSIPRMANVTVTVDVEGTLHLLAAPDDSTRVKYEKPFDAGSIRYAVFERRERGGPRPRHERHRGAWKVTQISGASVESEGTTRQIQSVTVAGESETFTITDPLALVAVGDLPAFHRGEDVTVTVATGDAADQVFLHSKGHRLQFESNGDGTFTGTWHVPRGQGDPIRSVKIDVLSHDTLLDDVAPYDSRAWVLSYRVERIQEF